MRQACRCGVDQGANVPSQINRVTVQHLELFAGLAADALDDILQAAASRRYGSGDTVFEQGQDADYFFVLLYGSLRVTQVTSEGRQVVVRMVNPGDLFGIAKALRRTDYPGTATAATESVAIAWPVSNWDTIVGTYPSFAVNAMQTMGSRLLEAQQRIRELSTEEVERRVAHAVLRLAQQSGIKEADGIRIGFLISKQDIAEMTGTTLHTVSRVMTAWEDEGLIKGGRQKLLVKDGHQLLLIADGLRPGLL